MRIGVVAPSSRFSAEAADGVQALAAAEYPEAEIVFHPQCFLTHNHFAGPDAARADALVEFCNDPDFDAIWFARGGYGACRIAEGAIARLGEAARRKTWLGYSDAGYLLAGLYRAGFPDLAHGPMPQDALREGGEGAVRRALGWLTRREEAATVGSGALKATGVGGGALPAPPRCTAWPGRRRARAGAAAADTRDSPR